MSVASVVPETYELTGDDARETLKRTGRVRLLKDAFTRLRVSDGFSHARSLGYMITLVLVQGIIAIVGLATLLGRGWLSGVVDRTAKTALPGPAGQTIVVAIEQAQKNGTSHQYLPLVLGSIGALITATAAMGQLERGLNRLYGVEKDRKSFEKYTRAFILALTAGVLSAFSFLTLALGQSVGSSLHNHTLDVLWRALRWPLGFIALVAAVAVLFRWCPRRRQPAFSWLAFGAAFSVAGCFLVSALLALFFRISTSFGQTYGPLAGMVALLLWSMLTAVALMSGAAIAAQLEAVRAGAPAPQDPEKVVESEPSSGGQRELLTQSGRRTTPAVAR
jgi:YihY family inner membrane protein